jgi:predicted small lipoprotein YifL
MKRTLLAMSTAVVALTAGLLAPAAQADDYMYMKPQMLEQAVLRVQMPTTLGSWEQYLYYGGSDSFMVKPTVCWGAKGPIYLPKAKVMGSVNYQVDPNTNGSVSIYQYATQAGADAALKALQAADCDGEPKVGTEDETLVTGEQGYDQMDAAFTGLTSALTYIDGDVRGYVSTKTTQRGLAVVQTQVRKYVKTPQSMKQQQDALGRVGTVNSKWHPRVVKAYESFGQGRAR